MCAIGDRLAALANGITIRPPDVMTAAASLWQIASDKTMSRRCSNRAREIADEFSRSQPTVRARLQRADASLQLDHPRSTDCRKRVTLAFRMRGDLVLGGLRGRLPDIGWERRRSRRHHCRGQAVNLLASKREQREFRRSGDLELERERRANLHRLRWLERNSAHERLGLHPAPLVEYQLRSYMLQQQRFHHAVAPGHSDSPFGALDHLDRLPNDRQ